MGFLKRAAIIYGICCFMVVGFFLVRMHEMAVDQNAYLWWSNRDSTMGLFFKRWDERNKDDWSLSADKTPRWYEIVQEPIFKSFPEDFQKARAKEYIRRYIENASGINYKEVEKWLFHVIDWANHDIYTYEQVFLGTPSDMYHSMEESRLRTALAYLPLGSYWYAIKDDLWMPFAFFSVLFGVPLLLIQIFFWVLEFIKKKRISQLFHLTKRSLIIISLISGAIGLFYGINVMRNEFELGERLGFISGKLLPFQMGGLVFVFSLVISFLGFWGLILLYRMTTEELMVVINKKKEDAAK